MLRVKIQQRKALNWPLSGVVSRRRSSTAVDGDKNDMDNCNLLNFNVSLLFDTTQLYLSPFSRNINT